MSRPYRGKKVIHKPDGSVTVVTHLGPKRRSGGGGGGGCFPSSTRVLTPSGWRPIGELRPNESVVSLDVATEALASRVITHRIDYGQRQIWALKFNLDQAPLQVTSTHSFLCKNGWKRVAEIEPGDILLCSTTGGLVEKTVLSATATQTQSEVHNIYTSVDNNFIVDGGFIAHNFSYLRAVRSWLHNLSVAEHGAREQPELRY